MHTETHPLAGQTITIQSGVYKGETFTVEDWWDKLSGSSWKTQGGNWACIDYAARVLAGAARDDDEVIYGKIKDPQSPVRLGKIINVSELEADSFAARWEDFRRMMLPANIPAQALELFKDAFYAGAANSMLLMFKRQLPGDTELRMEPGASNIVAEVIMYSETAAASDGP